MIESIIKAIQSYQKPEKAKIYQRFFKTGPGEYGEGDVFVGVTVPETRAIVKQFWQDVSLEDALLLLNSEIHEYRLTGLLILVAKYEKGDAVMRQQVYDAYLQNTAQINNWDLIDLTAPKIVGAHLIERDRGLLFKLAQSEDLWERRIAILSCFAFIRRDDFADLVKISEILLHDEHDLIHKAVGWMLREMGKRELELLRDFLSRHAGVMPRTMLRYAIEKMSPEERAKWMGIKTGRKG